MTWSKRIEGNRLFVDYPTFSFSLAIGQTKGKVTVRNPVQVSKLAEAEKAWLPFWMRFRKSIISRDKELFKTMMSVKKLAIWVVIVLRGTCETTISVARREMSPCNGGNPTSG